MAGVSTAQRLIDDQELLRRLLARYTLKECAAFIGVSYPTICARARRPEFLSQLKDLSTEMYEEVDTELRVAHGSISERVIEMSTRALDKLEALLMNEGTDDRLAARIAMDFLDRNEETAKNTKSTVKTEHAFMNPLVLQAAHKAAMEMDESTVPMRLDDGTH